MKKIILTVLSIIAISSLQAQTIVSVPTDIIDSLRPVPIQVELGNPDTSNFELTIKNGSKEVIRISTIGTINIRKIGSRFLPIDKSVFVITAINNGKPTSENNALKLLNLATEPIDVVNENVLIGTTEHTFRKYDKETLIKLEKNKFRFFIKSAQSKSAFVKKVVIELSNGNQKSLITINSTNLWWQPYLSIEGDFNDAQIKDIIFN
jgi:hypothetical protein